MAGLITNENLQGVLTAQDLGADFTDNLARESLVLSLGRNIGNISAGSATITVPEQFISAAFVEAGGEKPATDFKLGVKTLNVAKIASVIVIRDEELNDANVDILNTIVKPQVPKVFGKAIDQAVLFGTGAPTAWTDVQAGLVTQAVAKGNVVTSTGDVFADLFGTDGLIEKVETSGFDVNGFIGGTRAKSLLRGAVDANKRPLYQPFTDAVAGKHSALIYDQPFTVARNGAWDNTQALLVGGDFTNLVYGIRSDIEYKISKEATVKVGDAEINCFQQNCTALLMEMRVAVGILNPVNLENKDLDDHFPFAVLKAGA